MSTQSKGDKPALVTSQFLCQILSISRRTLHNWIKKGILPPPMRLGPKNHKLFWPSMDIVEFLKKAAPGNKDGAGTGKASQQKTADSGNPTDPGRVPEDSTCRSRTAAGHSKESIEAGGK